MSGRSLPAVPSPPEAFERFSRHDLERSIPERFEQQVSRYPDRIAVKTGGYELTYAALNQAANRVAHAILARRGEGEEPVALFLEQDGRSVSAILGVLKAGKICVPLASSLPEARVADILEEAQADLIVTDAKNLGPARRLARNSRRLIDIDEVGGRLPTGNPGLSILPEAFAYVIYTSGSTGRPKGVIQNHRNILRRVRGYTNSLHICADDRISLLASYSTGQGMSITFSALLNGAALCPFNTREQGVDLMAEWLIAEEITIYVSTATVFRHFARNLTGEGFPELRLIKLGGEPVRRSDVELYKECFSPHCVLVNALSSTETGNFSRYFIDKRTEITGSMVPVGYADEDMEILLLDDAGAEVGHGCIGEVALRSRYLSPGYWRDQDRTRAAFLFGRGSERIYRTGDLGRMRPDGCLEHLGRKDFQVKIRGFRVELGGIEAVLGEHPAVQEVVLATGKDVLEDDSLVAYVVPVPGQAPTSNELRGYVRENLPEHMVPSAIVFLDALPLAPNGKVDRRALPEPGREARLEPEAPFVAPRTPTEVELARIWADVLRLRRVGIHDNFFELGGHSLLAVQAMTRLNRHFGVELPLRALFEAPTVAGLALAVTQTRAEAETDIDQLLAEVERMQGESVSQESSEGR